MSEPDLEEGPLLAELAEQSQAEPFLAALREQLLLRSVTKEQAMERRRQWRQVAAAVEQQSSSWRHFKEVFLVSGATGEGVAALRDWLVAQAQPGLWPYHSTLATDSEPTDVMCAAVWSRLLETVPGSAPYHVRTFVEQWERGADGDMFLQVALVCRTERQMAAALGPGGQRIALIAQHAEQDLRDAFQRNIHLKLVVRPAKVPSSRLATIRGAEKFSDVFHNNSSLE